MIAAPTMITAAAVPVVHRTRSIQPEPSAGRKRGAQKKAARRRVIAVQPGGGGIEV
jgi:hypothetical protein